MAPEREVEAFIRGETRQSMESLLRRCIAVGGVRGLSLAQCMFTDD